MVRLSWLFAACVATVAAGVVHAESESEGARLRVVMRVHEHGKSVSDTIGDMWDSVKNETSDAIESVADELHEALYGSGSDEEEEPVEIIVVKQTVRKHKVVDTQTTVRHFKTDGEDLLDDIEEALFGSSSTSDSDSGSGSGQHEATEVGDDEEDEYLEDASEQTDEGEEEEEVIDMKTPPPVKKHHKKKHHKATKHHQAKKEEVKTVQKETATMALATDSISERRPRATTFVLIGAAVGAMVGIVALAVFVAVRRRRAASSASVLATHESDVEAITQSEEDEDLEDAAAPEAEDLEKGEKTDDVKLEGSI